MKCTESIKKGKKRRKETREEKESTIKVNKNYKRHSSLGPLGMRNSLIYLQRHCPNSTIN